MFRARANPARLLVSRTRPRPLKRSFSGYYQPRPIPFWSPVIWSIGACSTIYLACAAYEIYGDVQYAKARGSRWDGGNPIETLEDLEYFGGSSLPNRVADTLIRSTPPERPEFADAFSLTMRVMGVTAGVHVACSAMPAMKVHFVHAPGLSNNYTLLTSVFGHGGLVHLGVNLYGMFHFMPSTVMSPTFKHSGPHFTAFYLSAGILSSLAQHVTAIWPRSMGAMSSLGASGALFALVGAVGISYPNTQIGILFIPGSLPIGDALVYLALFDAIGILVRYPGLHLGHAAHLSGLALGVTYVKYGGDRKIWRPARKLAFNVMRSLGFL